jgi:CRP-like cAMP-binding protein
MKLRHAAALTAEDCALLEAVTGSRRIAVDAGETLVSEGEKPVSMNLVVDGIAARHKDLAGGRRSIVAFFVPGDLCDLNVAILGEMDHTISTLTPCTIIRIADRTIEEIKAQSPRISRALHWSTLVDEAILREWLVNIGHRSADQQIAHLLCELQFRLATVGRATQTEFELPLTQQILGEALGMSTVHVNRTMQLLRNNNLIVSSHRKIILPDLGRLQRFAEFDPSYLHLLSEEN